MAVRAQTSIEFLLILSAVVLVVLAGVMSLSEITKMQQGAYSTAKGGVENASSSLLTYLSNQTFGTGFSPISGGLGNYTNASLVLLELTKSEPYFVNQPAVIQLTAWDNYPNPMNVPRLLMWMVNSSGNDTTLSNPEEDNVTIIVSHTLTATFVPSSPGVYNVSAVAQDESGNTMINPNTGEPVLVKTNFTVLSIQAPSNGAVKTFNMDNDVVAENGSTHTETFSLPSDAVIYSAVLEITDSHTYEDRGATAQASYEFSQTISCLWSGQNIVASGIYSSSFFNQPGTVEIPQSSFITSASYQTNKYSGDTVTVYLNGEANPSAIDVVKPGMNTLSISIKPSHSDCQIPNGYEAATTYGSNVAAGDSILNVKYYSPSSSTSNPSDTIGSITVKTENSTTTAPQVTSVIDISNYLRGGYNELWFQKIEGSFHYKLVVTYA
jgi:hypothetical protein